MTSARPVVVITGRNRPHELFVLAYSAIAGIAMLVGAPRPSSIVAVVDHRLTYLWGVGLVSSGLFGLWGIFGRRDMERGLIDELGAMLVNAAVLLTFAGAVVIYSPGPGWFTAGISGMWAAANLRRAVLIRRDLREIRAARQDADAY